MRWFGTYSDDKQIWYGLIEPEEYEFYAILALMTICAAVHLVQPTRAGCSQNPAEPTMLQLRAIGRAAINAMESITHAENLKSVQQSIHKNDPEQARIQAETVTAAVTEALSREASERAAQAANKRHAPHTTARAWVITEWALHSGSYSGNKSAFSRTDVALVKDKFKDSKGGHCKGCRGAWQVLRKGLISALECRHGLGSLAHRAGVVIANSVTM